MEELEKNVIAVLHEINQGWVESVRDAKKENKYPSSTEMMETYSEKITLLLQHFREAKQRMRKKKGLFG